MAKQFLGLDLNIIRENPELVKVSMSSRGLPEALVDEVLELDQVYRALHRQQEQVNHERKVLNEGLKARGENFEELKIRARELAKTHGEVTARMEQARETLVEKVAFVPNLVHPEAPIGGENDFTVLKHVNNEEDAEFDFTPRAHHELGATLGLYDAERGAKVSGSRFVFLKGRGAILEKALIDFALAEAFKDGFNLLTTPTLVRPEIMEGTGFTTKHNDEIYYLPADELYLTGTSEVALAGYHADEILDLENPLYYAGLSTCYRREAGAAGRDTRGLIRLHQFTKLEGFIYTTPEKAEEEHEKLLALQESILQLLGLRYRVIDTATGDLGTSAYRKYDIEAWLPSQERYLELTSSSNCLTYQAKQLNIRYRGEKGNKTAATLNGTLATTRWLVAILEQLQEVDGTVKIPAVLHPYTHGITELRPQ